MQYKKGTIFNHKKKLSTLYLNNIFEDDNGNVFYSRNDGEIWNIHNMSADPVWITKLDFFSENMFKPTPYTIINTIKYHDDYLILESISFYKASATSWHNKRKLLYIQKDLEQLGEIIHFKYKGIELPNFRKLHYRSKGYIIFEVSAFELIDFMKKKKGSMDDSLLVKHFSELIESGLTENDNPVLLVGEYK